MESVDLKKYSLDPSIMQREILEKLDQNTGGKLSISDPTNPFVMLLEATTCGMSNAILETKSIIRKKYPSLATRHDDLLHHISDDQMVNMFAIPSTAMVVFYVNVVDLSRKGYKPEGANYVETTIPIGTEITILGTTLTLLNDIVVKLYSNGVVSVEQITNDNEIAFQDVGILDSLITTDANGITYIIFETRVKQVKKISKNIALTPSTGFADVINLSDLYYYSEVKYKNNSTGNQYKYLPKAFNDEYIDPLKPTCYVSVYDKDIQFKIPDVYLIERLISGTLLIDVYETKGKLYLPINKYTNNDFSIKLGDTTKSKSAATAPNILIWANSRDIIDGGQNSLSILELRDYIINHTTGDIDCPITEKSLIAYAKSQGYDLIKATDIITDRQYITYKPLPVFKSELLYSKQDIIFNTAELNLSDLIDNKQVITLKDKSIIKSGSVFRIMNGKMFILENDELEGLTKLTGVDLVNKCKDVKYYYTPYYYVIHRNELLSTVDVYDLDSPSTINNKILNKNNSFNYRVNIRQHDVIRTETGFRLRFNTASNPDYQKLDKSTLGFQVRLLLDNDKTYAYFEAVYDPNNDIWYADISTSINLIEETLDLTNGESELYTKRFKLDTKFEIFSYTTEQGLNDTTHFLQEDIWKFNPEANYTIFTKEEIKVKFGTNIKYIWNKIYSTYNERKFLKYTEDVPKVYTENVYEVDPETGAEVSIVDGQLHYNIIHRKGEQVQDSEGNPVYLHRKGDIKLDENGKPIIDEMSGVIRLVDIMLLEYEYKRATSSVYKQYNKMMLTALDRYINKDIKDMNKLVLEKTHIYYKSFKKLSNVIVNINNDLYYTPCVVSPIVTLYYTGTHRYTANEIDNLKIIIGDILVSNFEKDTFSNSEIKQDIISAISNDISSVKVSGIEASNSEIIKYEDKTSKFILAKLLELNSNNEFVVKYDFTINIMYI